MSHPTTAPPRLTIGVPVFDGEKYLDRALRSVAEQSDGDFEVLIADNASTDATEEIAREWVARDARFSYHRHDTNIGGARNSNFLLERCRSRWFKWAYHDDVCDEGMVARSFETLAAAPAGTVLAYPRVCLIDEEEVVVGRHDDGDLRLDQPAAHDRLRVLLARVVTQTQFGIMEAEVARAAGGVVVSSAGEMLLPAALAIRGRLALVPGDPIVSIRVHGDRHGGSRESEMAWVDPSRPRTAFPYSRSTPMLLDIVARSPLSLREKSLCAVAVLRWWTVPSARTIAGDIVRLPSDLGLVPRARRANVPSGSDP